MGGVGASHIAFAAEIKGMAKASLKVDTYLFNHAGTVGTPTEKWTVARGDLKFNVAIDNWEFCGAGTCAQGKTDQTGEFVDVVLQVRTPAPHSPFASPNNGAWVFIFTRFRPRARGRKHVATICNRSTKGC